jgi:hypothetical protein
MSVCSVDGRNYEVPAGLTTWGHVLDALEEGLGRERAVVTAVRFAGVDQSSFRDAVLQAQTIEANAPIDVETCPAHVMVAEGVDAALDGLEPLADAARQAAGVFRARDLAAAYSRLGDVLVTIQTLATLTAAVSRAGHTPRTKASDGDSAKLLVRIGQSLESLVAAAENEDWTSAADVLEFEVVDLLPSWHAVLGALAKPAGTADAGSQGPVRLRHAP